MNADRLIKLIRTERFGVNLFMGSHDFSPGFNAFYAAMPKKRTKLKGRGVQWHRDGLPALNRYVKEHTGKVLMKIISCNDGIFDEEALTLLRNRADGDNDRLWLAFEWERGPKGTLWGCFKEVEFPAQEPSHLKKGQRVSLLKEDGKFFPAGSLGTIVEDVTDKRVGRQDQRVPLGHCYRIAFDHRSNMPAAYISRRNLGEVDHDV